ncbi:hypothetical protein RI054_32g125310 [Pseudoscourfieldia marina]
MKVVPLRNNCSRYRYSSKTPHKLKTHLTTSTSTASRPSSRASNRTAKRSRTDSSRSLTRTQSRYRSRQYPPRSTLKYRKGPPWEWDKTRRLVQQQRTLSSRSANVSERASGKLNTSRTGHTSCETPSTHCQNTSEDTL